MFQLHAVAFWSKGARCPEQRTGKDDKLSKMSTLPICYKAFSGNTTTRLFREYTHPCSRRLQHVADMWVIPVVSLVYIVGIHRIHLPITSLHWNLNEILYMPERINNVTIELFSLKVSNKYVRIQLPVSHTYTKHCNAQLAEHCKSVYGYIIIVFIDALKCTCENTATALPGGWALHMTCTAKLHVGNDALTVPTCPINHIWYASSQCMFCHSLLHTPFTPLHPPGQLWDLCTRLASENSLTMEVARACCFPVLLHMGCPPSAAQQWGMCCRQFPAGSSQGSSWSRCRPHWSVV